MTDDMDLTILYITANQMPQRWVEFQIGHLRKAAGNAPIISLSRAPMTLGINLLDTSPKSYWNIYVQMLRGSELATTPFVAVAEDDTLYTYEHFHEFRPELDTVAFDMSWWSLLSWDPRFSQRDHRINAMTSAPRLLMIEALRERMEKYPNGPPEGVLGEVGRESADRRMGVTERKSVRWRSSNPCARLDHPTGTDRGRSVVEGHRVMKKVHREPIFEAVPYWGSAKEIVGIYLG